MNATQTIQTVVLNDHRFAVEERNGNMSFNLTMMSKPYGTLKAPRQWFRTESAKSYLDALSKVHKCTLTDLVEVRKGGTPELAGTWAYDMRIAMRFAQWLDPKFAIAVDDFIIKYLTNQIHISQPFLGVPSVMDGTNPYYNYLEVLKALGRSTKSGSVTDRKRKFPNHFKKFFGRNFITKEYAKLLQKKQKGIQLKLDLFNENTFLA